MLDILYTDIVLFVFFFFFQAEDGIRDLTVTGVQTCALPISRSRPWPAISDRPTGQPATLATGRLTWGRRARPAVQHSASARSRKRCASRSGERRVGEEGRSRGAAGPLKKKKTREGEG